MSAVLSSELPPGLSAEGLAAAAKAAHLRHVSDDKPGITRVRTRKGFRYLAPDGSRITDEATIARIQKLAVPPAYEEVWICPDPNGHIQAVGRDVRRRKQYRYHPRWREVRDEAKYAKMLVFGRVLPEIRKRVEHDLTPPGLQREKVLAALVRLLDTTLIRVGNEEYAKGNKSFGLTTLRRRHVRVGRGKLHFDFRGKSGLEHHIDLDDPRLARIVAPKAQAKKNVRQAVEAVSGMLGNTPAICRKCYIHPAILDGYLSGSLPKSLTLHGGANAGLSTEEMALLSFLDRC